ncbi:hypothetical protein LAZ67_4002456 [Cordylochernes scorpioides]|uniref:Uncharacterized protein n=1 Tax=Cordylochernes scorpioides TaxID=51811 RepID=A0ABY6KCZ9_9ARAC|nr:hypothetical protein LAZ67_4002456 [Cordylochernes scorpioides]
MGKLFSIIVIEKSLKHYQKIAHKFHSYPDLPSRTEHPTTDTVCYVAVAVSRTIKSIQMGHLSIIPRPRGDHRCEGFSEAELKIKNGTTKSSPSRIATRAIYSACFSCSEENGEKIKPTILPSVERPYRLLGRTWGRFAALAERLPACGTLQQVG